MLQCYNVTFPASQWSEILVKRVSMLPVALNYANGSKAAPSPCGKILPEPANRPTFCGVASCFCHLSPRAISSRYFLALFVPPSPTNIFPCPQLSLPCPQTSSLAHNRPSLALQYHPLGAGSPYHSLTIPLPTP